MSLTPEVIATRRETIRPVSKVVFRVAALYGLCHENVPLPVSETEKISSGPICVTGDPEADPSANVGILDLGQKSLRVRYGVQMVFPGLHELITSGKHDLGLLNPPRAVATDDCTLTPDMRGWHALGCMDFLPGSLWAGTSGG